MLLAALVAFNPEHDHKRTWPVQWRPQYARSLLELHQSGVSYARMRAVIVWYPTDSFWPGAVHDAQSFARNFGSIETKMLAAKKAAAPPPKPAEPRLKTPDELAAADPDQAERLREFRERYEAGR